MTPNPDDHWRVSWGALDIRAWAGLKRHGQVPDAVRRGMPFHGYPRLVLWEGCLAGASSQG